MLDLPLTKKKKKKTGFNLDAALDFKSPDEEKSTKSDESKLGNDGDNESAGANQEEDFDLDMDFSKMKKKKKSKKVIDDFQLPEKSEEEKIEDKENGKQSKKLLI